MDGACRGVTRIKTRYCTILLNLTEGDMVRDISDRTHSIVDHLHENVGHGIGEMCDQYLEEEGRVTLVDLAAHLKRCQSEVNELIQRLGGETLLTDEHSVDADH